MSDNVIIELNQDYFSVMYYGDKFNITEVRYFEFKHIVVDNKKILLTINDTVIFTIELTSYKEAIKVKKQIYNGKKRWKKTLPDAYVIDRRDISIHSNNHPTKTIQLTDIVNVCNSEDIVEIHYVLYDSEECLIYIKEESQNEARLLVETIKRKFQDSILPDEFEIHPNHIWVLKAVTDIEHTIKFSEIVDVHILNTDTMITCFDKITSIYPIRHKTVESAQRLVNLLKHAIDCSKEKKLTKYTIYDNLIDVDGVEIPWKDINSTNYESKTHGIISSVTNVVNIVQIKYKHKDKLRVIYIKEECEPKAKILVETIKRKIQDSILPDEFEIHPNYIWVLKAVTDFQHTIYLVDIANIELSNTDVVITYSAYTTASFNIRHKTVESAQRLVNLLKHAIDCSKEKKLTEYTIYDDFIDVDGIEIPWKDINATDYGSNIISITHEIINVTNIIMSNETQAKVLAKDLQDRARDWWKSTKSKPKRYVVSIRTMYNKYEMVGYYSHNESSIVHNVVNKKLILLNIQEVDEFPVRIDVTIDLVTDLTVPDSSEYGF